MADRDVLVARIAQIDPDARVVELDYSARIDQQPTLDIMLGYTREALPALGPVTFHDRCVTRAASVGAVLSGQFRYLAIRVQSCECIDG